MVVEDKKPEVLTLGSDGEKESGDESQSDEDDDVRIYNQTVHLNACLIGGKLFFLSLYIYFAYPACYLVGRKA